LARGNSAPIFLRSKREAVERSEGLVIAWIELSGGTGSFKTRRKASIAAVLIPIGTSEQLVAGFTPSKKPPGD